MRGHRWATISRLTSVHVHRRATNQLKASRSFHNGGSQCRSSVGGGGGENTSSHVHVGGGAKSSSLLRTVDGLPGGRPWVLSHPRPPPQGTGLRRGSG